MRFLPLSIDYGRLISTLYSSQQQCLLCNNTSTSGIVQPTLSLSRVDARKNHVQHMTGRDQTQHQYPLWLASYRGKKKKKKIDVCVLNGGYCGTQNTPRGRHQHAVGCAELHFGEIRIAADRQKFPGSRTLHTFLTYAQYCSSSLSQFNNLIFTKWFSQH